jgi:putative flippase GtrA
MKQRIKNLWRRWHTDFWRIFRFGITGTVSSLVHYAAYCLMLLVAGPNLSYTVGYGVGLICNYVLTTYFTFHEAPTRRNAAGFVMSHALNYALEIALLNLFLWVGASQWLAPILVMVVVVPINFLILRFVFVGREK